MSASNQSQKKAVQIEVELSLSPSIHSFSEATPPTLSVSMTSRAKTNLTLFTYQTPLSRRDALTSNGIKIEDVATGDTIKQARFQINRGPLKRIKGSDDEQYFLTLEPNTPTSFSMPFGRGDGTVKPQPREVVERGREVDDEGHDLGTRRSILGTGVDGLEPGHRYTVGFDTETLRKLKWAPVGKDEILVDSGGEGSYVLDYDWYEGNIEFSIKAGSIDVEA